MGYLSRLAARTLLAMSLVAGMAPSAFSQSTPAVAGADTDLTEIIVTGSRIALPNVTSTSPIQVVTAKDIEISGKIDVSDVLLQLPQNINNSFSDFNNRTSALTVAGGLSTADLRGLGPQRTLVLVNGRRLGSADANTANPNPAPDLDQIPTALIERIDVVTGGASAAYGSDAIAGVINFVMKRNFEGFQIGGQIGENWHSQHSTLAQNLETPGNQFVPRGSVPTNPPAVFNSQLHIYNGRDDLRYTAGFMAHVDVSDFIKPYAEFGFMNDRTDQKIAPSALFSGANPLDPTQNGNYNVNCDNPLLSAQQSSILCTPAQLAYVAANPGTACSFTATGTSPNCANVNIGRRNVEGGGRESYYEHNNYRAVVGAQAIWVRHGNTMRTASITTPPSSISTNST